MANELNLKGLKVKESTTSGSFIKTGGTASQFLKADGSVDNTSYNKGVSDDSLYKDPTTNLIRSNISTFSENLIYSGSATFTISFEPTNFVYVILEKAVDGSLSFPDYTFTSPNQLTINETLATNDKIKIVYEHFITQP